MNAKEFVKNKDYQTSKGFPEGKTTILLETADFAIKDFVMDSGEARTINQVTIFVNGNKETYNVPLSVMAKVQEAVAKGGTSIEINRQGLTKTDTKYVTYILDKAGKVIK
jgi:hypothetical protein